MKTKTKLLTALVCTTTLLAQTGCKKSDDNNGGGSSNSNLKPMEKLIVGKWQPTSKIRVTVRTSGNDTQNTMQSCETDDIYTFADDFYYTVSDGSNACQNAGQTYNASFPWSVTVDSSFQFTHGPGQYTPKIIYLDNSTLRMRATDLGATGYFTYSRK